MSMEMIHLTAWPPDPFLWIEPLRWPPTTLARRKAFWRWLSTWLWTDPAPPPPALVGGVLAARRQRRPVSHRRARRRVIRWRNA